MKFEIYDLEIRTHIINILCNKSCDVANMTEICKKKPSNYIDADLLKN